MGVPERPELGEDRITLGGGHQITLRQALEEGARLLLVRGHLGEHFGELRLHGLLA